MAQYEANILRLEISHGAAINRLVAMSDDDLIGSLPQWMLEGHPRLTPRSWRPDEPEYEALATELRTQVRADLLAAYFGDTDYRADERLAYARTSPHPTLIYLGDFEPDEDEPDEYESTNPVVRLRSLGITTAPLAETPEPIVLDMNVSAYRLEAAQDRLDATHNRIIHRPITTTTTASHWATSTASDGWNGYVVTPETDQAWRDANADIDRFTNAYRNLHTIPRPRMSDLDVVEFSADVQGGDDPDMEF